MAKKSEVAVPGDIRASFARTFGAWRLQHSVPLKRVALDLNVGVSTVNAWELGERFPTGEHLQALVNYTGVPSCRFVCERADQCLRTQSCFEQV